MSERKRVALVTGANKGIGMETARQLGHLGITVLLGARDCKKGVAAATALREQGINVHAVELDVANPAHRAALVARIEQEFGVLDILVNNAGVLLDASMMGNATSTTPLDTLRATFDTNFFSVVALTQALLPLLAKSHAGRIVNVSSILGSLALQSTDGGLDGKPFAYDASKAALNAFTIHLAHELRDTSIKVNAAHPGWVKTAMGTDAAPMSVSDGAKTEVTLATLPATGPTGGFFHRGDTLPW